MRVMQGNDLLFPQNVSVERSVIIKNINFIPREIDVMACLLNARGTSKISSLLEIAPSTILTHIHNIMLKIGCHSREGIIDFIEHSCKTLLIKEHYRRLILENLFIKSLKEISKLQYQKRGTYLVVYWQDHNLKNIIMQYLGAHLTHARLKVKILD